MISFKIEFPHWTQGEQALKFEQCALLASTTEAFQGRRVLAAGAQCSPQSGRLGGEGSEHCIYIC